MYSGGLWHGAALKFIVWGGLHGLALTLHKLWTENVKVPVSRWGNYASILITFHFVAFCWMYFIAADMYTVKLMLSNISTNFDFMGIGSQAAAYWKVFALILIGFAVHFLPSNRKNRAEWWYSDVLALRGGVFYENKNKGNRQFLNLGASLKYNMFAIDFSYLASLNGRQSPLANTLRFTLRLNLAGN